jgi:hypothetical protein
MDRATSLAWELVGPRLAAGERVRAAATCRDVASAMAATGMSAPLGPCREYPRVSVEMPPRCDREMRALVAGCAYVVRRGLGDAVDDDPMHEECGGWCERERYEDIRRLVLDAPPPPGVSIEFRTSCPSGPLETLDYGAGPTFVAESLDLAAPEPAGRELFDWTFDWDGGYTDEAPWHYRVDTRHPRGPCVEASVDVGAARLSISFGGCEDHPDARWSCPSFEASLERFDDEWTLDTGDEHAWHEELYDSDLHANCVSNGRPGPWQWSAAYVAKQCGEIEAGMARRYRESGPGVAPVVERARYLALFASTVEALRRLVDEFPDECRDRLARMPSVGETSVKYAHGLGFRFFDARVLRKLEP